VVNVLLVALAVATMVRPSLITSIGALVLGGAIVAWLLTTFARGMTR